MGRIWQILDWTRWPEAWKRATIFLLLAGGLVVRLALVQERWVNPDEGAHLMDARLVLEGKVPVADFEARQPLYVYLLAASLSIFGVHLLTARLLVVLLTMASGYLLYRFVGRLFDRVTALVSTGIFLFAPFSLIWTAVLKTEIFSVFFGLLALTLVWDGRQSDHLPKLAVAGAVAALAFYIRQTALVIPMTASLFFLLADHRELGRAIRRLLAFAGGYLLLALVVMSVYGLRMAWFDILFSRLNPLNILMANIGGLLGMAVPGQRVDFSFLGQRPEDTVNAMRVTFLFHGALFVGLASSFWVYLQAKAKKPERVHAAYLMISIWALGTLAMYGYHTRKGGFFTPYFVEMLPALAAVTGFCITGLVRSADRFRWMGRMSLPAAVVLMLIGGVHHVFWRYQPSFDAYFFILGLGLLLIFLSDFQLQRFLALTGVMIALIAFRLMILQPALGMVSSYIVAVVVYLLAVWQLFGPRLVHVRNAAVLTMLLVTAAYGMATSGKAISPSYHCVWAPETFDEVVRLIGENSHESDVILSGGMIWTFETGRRPFMDIPHTAYFRVKYDETVARLIQAGFQMRPPRLIILDGWTERNFQQFLPIIEAEIESSYEELTPVGGSHSPVRIFKLIRRQGQDEAVA